jgi:hypothetical protein
VPEGSTSPSFLHLQVSASEFPDMVPLCSSGSLQRYFNDANVLSDLPDTAAATQQQPTRDRLAPQDRAPVDLLDVRRALQHKSEKAKTSAVFGVVGLLFGLVAAGAWVKGALLPARTVASSAAAPLVSAKGTVGEGRIDAQLLSAEEAVRLIGRWQAAKQTCLGKTHDLSLLSSVLVGQALKDMQQRSQSFRDNGCFIDFRLQSCQLIEGPLLESRHASSGAEVYGVTARLHEEAAMFSNGSSFLSPKQEQLDQYSRSCLATNRICRDTAGWKIREVAVADPVEGSPQQRPA